MIGTFAEFFQKNSKLLHYRKSEMIIRPDYPPTGIFYIEKGYVRVYFLNKEGEEKIHIIYKEDELFPLLWAVTGERKQLFYEALTEVNLRRVSKAAFMTFALQDSRVLKELLERLAAVSNIFVDRLQNLEISKAYPRIVDRLLLLVDRFGVKEGKEVRINVPIKHKDIASSVGLTRETVSRELEKLEHRGLIYRDKQLIIIKNLRKVKQELEKCGEET